MVKRADLFLVDVTFLLEASEGAFRGAPLFVDREGEDHTIVYGVLRDLLRIRNDIGIRNAIVLIGSEAERASTDSNIDNMCRLLSKLHVAVVREPKLAVGSLCGRLAPTAGWLITANRSLLQLVTAELSVIRPGKEMEIITLETLQATEGVRPEQIPSLLALTTGPKATVITKGQALRILEVHGGLEPILRDPSLVASSKLRRQVSAHREILRGRLLDLVVAKTTWQPPSFGDADLQLVRDDVEARQVIRDHGFLSLLRSLPVPKAHGMALSVQGTKATCAYAAVVEEAGFRKLEARILEAGVCALDTEASDKDPRKASLFGVAFSFREGEAFYVPVTQADLPGTSSRVAQAWLRHVMRQEVRFVGHNVKYDYVLLRKHGIDIKDVHFDTMLATYECFGDWDFFNLSAVVKRLLGRAIGRYRDLVGEGLTLLDVPFKELVEHACADADMTLRLYHRLQGELKMRSIEAQFGKETMALLATLGKKECDGIKVSKEVILRLQRKSEKEAAALRDRVMAEAGRQFDLDAKEEMTRLLRERGLLREGGRRSITRLELEQLACGHSVPRLIVKYQRARRRVKQLEAVSAQIKRGRLFPLFSQISSDHGCLSWADPPFSERDAVRYRGAVVDKTMRRRMPKRETALEILEGATQDPTLSRDRKKGVWPLPDGGAPVDDADAGDVVISLATGVSDAALCQRFLIDPMRAARLRSAAEARYARLFGWLENYRKDAVAQGFASYQGRRKYLEGLRSSDMDRRQRATRSVVRWLVKY
jgi:DNA polymerase-1